MRNSFQTMEEQQWLKNNTDCVYFLASPLTCKKGGQCEYRHSEFARLNPVDCLYWLSGGCLNENCAYRHPPLDGLAEESLDSANMYQRTPASVTKSNTPCRFFANGYCNKGESCLFLHGASDNDNQGSMEIVSTVVNKPAIDRMITVGNDSDTPLLTHAIPALTGRPAIDNTTAMRGNTRSGIPITSHANPSANTNRANLNKEIAMGNGTRRCAPVMADVHPAESYPQKRVGIDVNPEVNIRQSATQNVSRQIPNQQSRGPLLRENTSQGLNRPLHSREFTQRTPHAEQRSCDQVQDFTEQEDLESSPGFDVQDNRDDPDGYSREYGVVHNVQHPDEEHHSYDSSDNEILSIHANNIPSHIRRRSFELHPSHNRNLIQTRLNFGSGDLRQVLLQKRRLTNGRDQNSFSSTFRSSRNGQRYQQTGFRHMQGRLASKYATRDGVGWKNSFLQRKPWHSRTSKPGQHFTGRRGKQLFKPRKSKSSEEFCERTEPSSWTAEENFQGPKPLSEILKEKRMPKSEVNGIFSY